MVAIIIGGLFFLLVAGFVTMVFFIQDEARLNAVGPIAAAPGAEQGGLVFHGTANIWEVRGRMTVDAERSARFAIDLIGPTGQPAPPSLDFRLLLAPPDENAAQLALNHSRTGPGSYLAQSGPLPTTGRWTLRIELPEITGVFGFDIDH